MPDPITISLVCYFAFSAILSVYKEKKEAEIRAENRVTHLREEEIRLRKERWERSQSVTKLDPEDIRLFLEWFQHHTELASHVMQGVSGILDDPCSIPALDAHFEYRGVVLTLSQNHSYGLTIAANNPNTILTFWREVNNHIR